ncbi:hypothetical protein ZWY2020_026627 [Hordeum vulgare]|nr:hypothetical protein ZWY2020_026627 [Hordeum vulgare]
MALTRLFIFLFRRRPGQTRLLLCVSLHVWSVRVPLLQLLRTSSILFLGANCDGFVMFTWCLSRHRISGQHRIYWRSLLQTKNDCPISFEIQNYTILTSKCKAPYYPPLECCDAFKEFACPFAVYINNQSTNCGDTMFSYIIIRGYPKGLFADECLNGKEGVSCEGIPEIGTDVPSGGRLVQGVSSYLVLLLCGLGALLFL